MPEQFVEVVAIASIKEKEAYCTQVQGVSLAVCLSKGSYYAVTNKCSHAASTFDGGRVRGHFLVCPLHGVMFDLTNGEPTGSLAKKPLHTYTTRVNTDSMLEVDLNS